MTEYSRRDVIAAGALALVGTATTGQESVGAAAAGASDPESVRRPKAMSHPRRIDARIDSRLSTHDVRDSAIIDNRPFQGEGAQLDTSI